MMRAIYVLMVFFYMVAGAEAADRNINPKNMMSAYESWSGLTFSTKVLFRVPDDKHFVLTDIVGKAIVTIYENNTIKLKTRVGGRFLNYYSYPNPIQLTSGIVFAPGSEVKVDPSDSPEDPYVTLSGYLR